MSRGSSNVSVTLSLSAATLTSVFGAEGASPAALAFLLEGALAEKAAAANGHRAAYAESKYPSLGYIKPQTLGVVGEGMVRYVIAKSGTRVACPKVAAYDLLSQEDGRVEVKTARVSEKGRYVFGGLDVRKFDVATLVAMGHQAPRMWAFPAESLYTLYDKARRIDRKRSTQRAGAKTPKMNGIGWNATTGYTFNFDAANPPAWMSEFEITGAALTTAYSAVLGK